MKMLWTNPNDNAAMINLKSTHNEWISDLSIIHYPLYNNAYYRITNYKSQMASLTRTQQLKEFSSIAAFLVINLDSKRFSTIFN